MENNKYDKINNGHTAEGLISHMESFLRTDGNMETQRIDNSDQGVVILQDHSVIHVECICLFFLTN